MKKKKQNNKQHNAEQLPEDFFTKAKYGLDGLAALIGAKAVEPLRKGGRPRIANPKQNGTLRLDPEVWESIKATGKGYNMRVEKILREALDQGRL